MKKAVMYGAGNIGRGFIGKVFADSGYRVCFLDINEAVVNAMNTRNAYTVRIVDDAGVVEETVKNIYAVNANEEEAVLEMAACDVMATAVGVNVLPHIVGAIAEAIKLRIATNNRPLNIILAENQMDVNVQMRNMLYSRLDASQIAWVDENLGLVEASIGRMVPPLTQSEREGDPLLIAVEPYAELPVDALAFKGELPALVGLKPFTPFQFYVKRKLFLHNMGHAICAYLGWQKGYTYISDAIRDVGIYKTTETAMASVVKALCKEYPQIPAMEVESNKTDLLHRFHNRILKDTIARVANDPVRKLRREDRLVGAALCCMENGVSPDGIVEGIAAALQYDNPADAAAQSIQADIREKGMAHVLERHLGLGADTALAKLIFAAVPCFPAK